MTILAMDSSGMVASAAIWRDDRILAEEDREGFVSFGRDDTRRDIFGHFLKTQRPFIERAQGRQPAFDRTRGLMLFLQHIEHPGLDIALVQVIRVELLGLPTQKTAEVTQVIAIGFYRSSGVFPFNSYIIEKMLNQISLPVWASDSKGKRPNSSASIRSVTQRKSSGLSPNLILSPSTISNLPL